MLKEVTRIYKLVSKYLMALWIFSRPTGWPQSYKYTEQYSRTAERL